MSTVAGIAVSPTTTSAGERVPSADRFEDRSRRSTAAARRGRARRPGRGRHWPSTRRRRAFPAWAALGAGGPRRPPAPAGRPDRPERGAAGDGRVPRHGDAGALAEGPRDRPRCAQLPRLRRPGRRVPGARVGVERHPQPRDPDALRPGRGHHALERAVHAVDLEDGARAGRRLHRGPEAGRVVAAVVLAARRPDRRGRLPARRVQRRPGHRRGGGRRAGRRTPRPPRQLHRLARDRRARSARPRPPTSCRSPASWAARAR